MSTPVTVITPACNAESFLEETIRSVLSQTNRDFQYVIIDDASEDDTYKIATSWQTRDARIRVLRQPVRGGPVLARNRGLAETTSEFVALIDHDDLWHPDFLHHLTRTMKREPAHTLGVFCYSINFTHGTRRIEQASRSAAGHHDLASFLRQGCPPSTCSALLIRRDAFLQTGGFSATTAAWEDTELWLRMLSRHPRTTFLCLPEILVWRRSRRANHAPEESA